MMDTTYLLKEQIDKAVEYLLKAINFAKKNSRYSFCGRLLNNGTYMVEHRLATETSTTIKTTELITFQASLYKNE